MGFFIYFRCITTKLQRGRARTFQPWGVQTADANYDWCSTSRKEVSNMSDDLFVTWRYIGPLVPAKNALTVRQLTETQEPHEDTQVP